MCDLTPGFALAPTARSGYTLRQADGVAPGVAPPARNGRHNAPAGSRDARLELNNAMEVNLMETTMNNIHPDTSKPADDSRRQSAASDPAGRPGDDVVRRSEFRQAQWLVGIVLAAILGSQGFLYMLIMDLQRDLQSEIGGVRVEIQAVHTDMQVLRTDMEVQHTAIKDEIRAEHDKMRADIGSDIDGLSGEVNTLRGEVIDVRERVIRIEAHLGIASAPDEEPTS